MTDGLMESLSLVFEGGFKLSGGILGFDHPGAGLSFLSSAEVPGAWRSRKPLCTETTASLLRNLRREFRALVLPYSRPTGIGSIIVTLFPAAPLPGAAAILVEHGGRRLLYCAGLPDRSVHLPACDIVAAVVAPEPGLPSADFRERLTRSVTTALSAGMTPVIRSNSFGGAIAVSQALSLAGVPCRQHENGFRHNAVWRATGFESCLCARLGSRIPAGSAVLLPLHLSQGAVESRIVAPWRICVARPGEDGGPAPCDELIRLHAGLEPVSMVELVSRTSPAEVVVWGQGAEPCRAMLAGSGVEVRTVDGTRQCALDLS